jgi:hypothetical protein
MGAPPDLTKIQTAVVDFFERQKRPYEMDRGRTTCWRNGHFSFNVGRSRAFGSKKVVTGQNMRRDKSRIYDACKEAFPDFPFDGVQVNRNFQCKPHRDRLNVGDSLLFAFGDYTGGALVVEGREIDARTPYVFDAHANTHWVAPFEGTRYSVVLFPHRFSDGGGTMSALGILDSYKVATGVPDLTQLGRYGSTFSALAGVRHWKEILLAVVLHLIAYAAGMPQGPNIVYSTLSGVAIGEGRLLYAVAPATMNGVDAVQTQTVANNPAYPDGEVSAEEQRYTTLANFSAMGVGYVCAKCKLV